MLQKQCLRSSIILMVLVLTIAATESRADNKPCGDPITEARTSCTGDGGTSLALGSLPCRANNESRSACNGFHGDPKDLNKYYPLSLDTGKDTDMVREITKKLGVSPIKVYDIPGMKDAFAVKPVSGMMTVFTKNPEFEGIIIDSNYMNVLVDVTPEEIKQHREWGKTGGLSSVDKTNPEAINASVVAFTKQGRERRMGVLAHEVAHMLLPADLRSFIEKNTENKDIQVLNVRVKKMLKNLRDAISEGKLNLSSDASWQFANEMAADYVTGGILAYMGVGEAGIEYMMHMYDLSGDKGNATHLRGNERLKVVNMGYEAHSLE